MKVDKERLSVAEVARAINMQETTVRNWILWYEQNYPDTCGLVLPKRSLIECGSRLFRAYKPEDVEVFKQFRDARLKRWGVLSEFNAKRCWGKYGKNLLLKQNRMRKNARKPKPTTSEGSEESGKLE